MKARLKDLAKSIDLGVVMDQGKPTDQRRCIPVSDLVGHVSIVGVAGSGKTSSVKHILRQLWLDHRITFMVVGSLHGEYDELVTEAIVRHVEPGPSTSFLFFDKPPDERFLIEDDELPLYAPVVLDLGALSEQEAGTYLHSLVHALTVHLNEYGPDHADDSLPRHVLVLEQARLNPYLLPTDLNTLAHYGHAVIMVDQGHWPIHDAALTRIKRSALGKIGFNLASRALGGNAGINRIGSNP